MEHGNCDNFHRPDEENQQQSFILDDTFSLTIRQIVGKQKIPDDSPKYHSNVNFQPSKSDKSIDFDVTMPHTKLNSPHGSSGEKKIICRGFSISFNSIKPITNIHIYHKMVKDLLEGKGVGWGFVRE